MHVRLHLLIRVNKHTISLILTDRAFKRFKEIMGNIEAIDFIIMTLATKVNFYILLIQKKPLYAKFVISALTIEYTNTTSAKDLTTNIATLL